MRKILIMAIAAMSFASCQQSASKAGSALDSAGSSISALSPASADAAVLTFEKPGYDFGKIKAGDKVQYEFKFKNTGKSPLIITNATATCGCTVPETPKAPIKPGADGVIKVVFDSTGKSGMQDKIITVTSNGDPAVNEVHLVGVVNPA